MRRSIQIETHTNTLPIILAAGTVAAAYNRDLLRGAARQCVALGCQWRAGALYTIPIYKYTVYIGVVSVSVVAAAAAFYWS